MCTCIDWSGRRDSFIDGSSWTRRMDGDGAPRLITFIRLLLIRLCIYYYYSIDFRLIHSFLPSFIRRTPTGPETALQYSTAYRYNSYRMNAIAIVGLLLLVEVVNG